MDSGTNVGELWEAILRAVRLVVGYDGARLVGTSPVTGLCPGSLSFSTGYDAALGHALLRDRSAGADPCSPADLARLAVPAAVVGSGSGRLTRRVAPDAGCELRLLLRDTSGVWGLLGLLRDRGPGDRRRGGHGPAAVTGFR